MDRLQGVCEAFPQTSSIFLSPCWQRSRQAVPRRRIETLHARLLMRIIRRTSGSLLKKTTMLTSMDILYSILFFKALKMCLRFMCRVSILQEFWLFSEHTGSKEIMGKDFWGWIQVKVSRGKQQGRRLQAESFSLAVFTRRDVNHTDLLATTGNDTRKHTCLGSHAVYSISINYEDP